VSRIEILFRNVPYIGTYISIDNRALSFDASIPRAPVRARSTLFSRLSVTQSLLVRAHAFGNCFARHPFPEFEGDDDSALLLIDSGKQSLSDRCADAFKTA